MLFVCGRKTRDNNALARVPSAANPGKSARSRPSFMGGILVRLIRASAPPPRFLRPWRCDKVRRRARGINSKLKQNKLPHAFVLSLAIEFGGNPPPRGSFCYNLLRNMVGSLEQLWNTVGEGIFSLPTFAPALHFKCV